MSYQHFLASTSRRHHEAAFGKFRATAPIIDTRMLPDDSRVFPSSPLPPPPPEALTALAEIERTNRCMSAAERMAARFRR